jgi:hypothetical protein
MGLGRAAECKTCPTQAALPHKQAALNQKVNILEKKRRNKIK